MHQMPVTPLSPTKVQPTKGPGISQTSRTPEITWGSSRAVLFAFLPRPPPPRAAACTRIHLRVLESELPSSLPPPARGYCPDTHPIPFRQIPRPCRIRAARDRSASHSCLKTTELSISLSNFGSWATRSAHILATLFQVTGNDFQLLYIRYPG